MPIRETEDTTGNNFTVTIEETKKNYAIIYQFTVTSRKSRIDQLIDL